MTGKLSVSNGRMSGTCPSGNPIRHNASWPCPNGTEGGMSVPAGVRGVLMHTMVGDLPGTVQVFNEASFQASAHFGVDQEGNIYQFGPVNGWRAWHCAAGNSHWYGIEFADHGKPANPLTQAQIGAGAQLLEALSRPSVGNFPMQITNSVNTEGFGVHRMGGQAYGGHSCPQLGDGSGPRSGQRSAIIALAMAIRGGKPAPPPNPHPTLREGDSGNAVKTLQTRLNAWGAARPALAVDGQFGPATDAAVRQFQKTCTTAATPNHRFEVNGVVGPLVWAALLKTPPPR